MIVVNLTVAETWRSTVNKLRHDNRAKPFKHVIALVPIQLLIVELLVPVLVYMIIRMFNRLLKVMNFVKDLEIRVKTILLIYLLLICHVVSLLIHNV